MTYIPKKSNVIIYEMKRNNLTKADICRLLGCSINTLLTYFERPSLIRLSDLILLSGVFGIPVEVFVYCLLRSQVHVKRPMDKWYMESVKLSGETILNDLPKDV